MGMHRAAPVTALYGPSINRQTTPPSPLRRTSANAPPQPQARETEGEQEGRGRFDDRTVVVVPVNHARHGRWVDSYRSQPLSMHQVPDRILACESSKQLSTFPKAK